MADSASSDLPHAGEGAFGATVAGQVAATGTSSEANPSLEALSAVYQLPESYLSTLRADRDNFRTTLRWLLTAYGAIGTVLVAGISFTSLNNVSDAELWLALAGAALALGSVAGAVVLTARATVSVPISYAAIAKASRRSVTAPFTGNPERFLFKRFQSGEGNLLRGQFDGDIVEYSSKFTDGDPVATAISRGGLTQVVSYLAMRYRFQVATRTILVTVLAVAVGIVTFAYSVGEKGRSGCRNAKRLQGSAGSARTDERRPRPPESGAWCEVC